MRCPYCGAGDSQVIDTNHDSKGGVRRRRKCKDCNQRFSTYERAMVMNRFVGPYWWGYWALILCNVAVPQLLWSYKIRTNPIILFIICQFISVGMWLERFVIVVMSLHRDFMPSAWDGYRGTRWDWGMYIGTMGFFLVLCFIFIRSLPIISIFEMRELIHKQDHKNH